MSEHNLQLRGYIPPTAPLNMEPATENEPPLRPVYGFTVNWFHQRIGTDYSEKYHTDPEYRYLCLKEAQKHLAESFPDSVFSNHCRNSECATISGVYGVCLVAMLYGLKPIYYKNNWPAIAPTDCLSVDEIKKLKPFDLSNSPIVEQLINQMDIIKKNWGAIDGYLNYQGVINNAFKIRGAEIFSDLIEDPGLVHFLFDHITDTMINLIQLVQDRQRTSGFQTDGFCTGNCVVNMISPELYREFVLPYDIRLSKAFRRFGVHTCDWTVDLYLDDFLKIENIGYLDFGSESNHEMIKKMFPNTRKNVFYNAAHLVRKPLSEQEFDIRRIYETLGLCDVTVADIEITVPDKNIIDFISMIQSMV